MVEPAFEAEREEVMFDKTIRANTSQDQLPHSSGPYQEAPDAKRRWKRKDRAWYNFWEINVYVHESAVTKARQLGQTCDNRKVSLQSEVGNAKSWL